MVFPRKVYLIYNTVTNKGYVGSSGNLDVRIKNHFQALQRGNHPMADMQADFDDYGHHFAVRVLDTIYDIDQTHKEHDWMRKLNTYNRRYGYNYMDNVVVMGRPLKRTRNFYEYQGQLLSAGELALLTDIPYSCLQSRLIAGWSAERAITEPVRIKERW